jgi:LysR family hydrogen peroxide-inducible transcriptional activator
MIVTLRQMQYVVSVAKHGSFSKAAEECNADQSTVSQQIKTFEERLGITIFDRNTLPITITNEGKELVVKCESIINQVDELIQPFKRPKSDSLLNR